MPQNGLGGQNLSLWAPSSVDRPSQALTKQPSTMVLSDRQTIQPFQAEGSRAGIPYTCFFLAPVSESLRINDPGNNERGAGLSSSRANRKLHLRHSSAIAVDEDLCS